MTMRRALVKSVIAGGFAVFSGCHQYIPLDTAPPPGEHVALVITDRGRIGLADRLGAGVGRVEGRLTQNEPNEYVLDVFQVGLLGGQKTRWSGESVRLNKDFVGRVERRELARTRTWLLAGAVAAGITAFIATRGLLGSGNDNPDDEPPPPPSSRRGR
jgi:hypothetical protein